MSPNKVSPNQLRMFFDGDKNQYSSPPAEDLGQSLPVISTNLAERAERLLKVIDFYSSASKLAGFNKVAKFNEDINRRYSPSEISEIGSAEDLNKSAAYKEFYKAYGAQVLIAAGIDSAEVNHDARFGAEGIEEFKLKFIGPFNKDARKDYRKVLSKQQKQKHIDIYC